MSIRHLAKDRGRHTANQLAGRLNFVTQSDCSPSMPAHMTPARRGAPQGTSATWRRCRSNLAHGGELSGACWGCVVRIGAYRSSTTGTAPADFPGFFSARKAFIYVLEILRRRCSHRIRNGWRSSTTSLANGPSPQSYGKDPAVNGVLAAFWSTQRRWQIGSPTSVACHPRATSPTRCHVETSTRDGTANGADQSRHARDGHPADTGARGQGTPLRRQRCCKLTRELGGVRGCRQSGKHKASPAPYSPALAKATDRGDALPNHSRRGLSVVPFWLVRRVSSLSCNTCIIVYV